MLLDASLSSAIPALSTTEYFNHYCATKATCPRDQRQRHKVSSALNQVRELRNRVFHHEPLLWLMPDLCEQHGKGVTLVRWLDPHLADWLARHDRLPVTWAVARPSGDTGHNMAFIADNGLRVQRKCLLDQARLAKNAEVAGATPQYLPRLVSYRHSEGRIPSKSRCVAGERQIDQPSDRS